MAITVITVTIFLDMKFYDRENEMKVLGNVLQQNYYKVITKSLPIFAKENSKKVRYQLNDCFLIFWFRFFYKYQALVENKALKSLGKSFGEITAVCLAL